MTYNFKTKKCNVKQITTKEGEGYILGKTVKKISDDVFFCTKAIIQLVMQKNPISL